MKTFKDTKLQNLKKLKSIKDKLNPDIYNLLTTFYSNYDQFVVQQIKRSLEKKEWSQLINKGEKSPPLSEILLNTQIADKYANVKTIDDAIELQKLYPNIYLSADISVEDYFCGSAYGQKINKSIITLGSYDCLRIIQCNTDANYNIIASDNHVFTEDEANDVLEEYNEYGHYSEDIVEYTGNRKQELEKTFDETFYSIMPDFPSDIDVLNDVVLFIQSDGTVTIIMFTLTWNMLIFTGTINKEICTDAFTKEYNPFIHKRPYKLYLDSRNLPVVFLYPRLDDLFVGTEVEVENIERLI